MNRAMVADDARIGQRRWRASTRRVASLARAELMLLTRSPAALFVAGAMPLALVFLFRLSVPPELSSADGLGAFIVTSLTGATLVLVVYYNLTTALVVRREDLSLKRLRTGDLGDAEIIAGTAAPAVAIAWGQILIGTIAAAAFFDLAPTNLLLILAAVGGGTVVFVLLALATSGLSGSKASAELTTTPVLIASLALSGMMLPVEALPEPLAQIARGLPLTPVIELLRLGLTGRTSTADPATLTKSFAPAAVPLLVLVGWLVAGLLGTRRWFGWEPRR